MSYDEPLETLAGLLDGPYTQRTTQNMEDALCHCFGYIRPRFLHHERYTTMQRFVQCVPALAPVREGMVDYCTMMTRMACMRELEECAEALVCDLQAVHDALVEPKKLLNEENLTGIRQLCDTMLNDFVEFIEFIIPVDAYKPEYLGPAIRSKHAIVDVPFNEAFKTDLSHLCCEAANTMILCDEPMRIMRSMGPADDDGMTPTPKLASLYELIHDIFFHCDYQGQVRPRKARRCN